MKGRFPPDRGPLLMHMILLVDGDPIQARWRKSVLEERFSDVQRVSGAVDALCLVEEPQFAKDLVLVVCGDLMPGIGGPAFVAELQIRMPLLPVLVLANGSDDAPSDYRGDHIRYLDKPAGSKEILAAASQMIAA
jgi:DNA-binding NtrC family response regulator